MATSSKHHRQSGWDEVLLDIGYKTEGVPDCPSSTSTPAGWNKGGDEGRSLVLTKEDKRAGSSSPEKQRTRVRACLGRHHRGAQGEGQAVRSCHRSSGWLITRTSGCWFPARLAGGMRRVRGLQPYIGKEIEAKIIELDKNRNVVLSRRAWLEGPVQCQQF